jgi:large conductance mechanosensitive channel
MSSFIQFIRQQGVIGLAVGFILGGSVSRVVSSFVEDVINPLLGLVLGFTSNINEHVLQIGPASVRWGSFLSTLLDFFIIAAVVYYIFKGLKLDKIDRKKE